MATPDIARTSPSLTTTSSAANGAFSKRKRSRDGPKYYAVREGRKPGVYATWEECLAQVKGHKGAQFRTFPLFSDAQSFVAGHDLPSSSSNLDKNGDRRFYAVQIGHMPGVYTDWPTASAQIAGVKRPRLRKFNSRAEAEAFVAEGKKGSAAVAVAVAQHTNKKPKLANGVVAPGGLRLQQQTQFDITQGNNVEHLPGTAPLPLDAEDGFDPNIHLSSNGDLVYKSDQEKIRTKIIPKSGPAPVMLNIYTDGSSLSNGNAGARAGVGVYFGPGDSKNVSEALTGTRQTNQRAELTAILRALDLAPRNRHVTIYTDSKYSIDCVTKWYKNWSQNGWLTVNRKPVENRDLVQDVRAKIEERQTLAAATCFTWVKGHSGHAGNVQADRLAVEGAMSGKGIHPKVTSAITTAATSMGLAEGTAGLENVKKEDGGEEEGAEDSEVEAFKALERAMQEDDED